VVEVAPTVAEEPQVAVTAAGTVEMAVSVGAMEASAAAVEMAGLQAQPRQPEWLQVEMISPQPLVRQPSPQPLRVQPVQMVVEVTRLVATVVVAAVGLPCKFVLPPRPVNTQWL
jgi:hypothetical protein